MSRNSTIDSFKGIGIIWIILIHFSQHFSVGPFTRIAYNGDMGVELMFMLSGYLITDSLARTNNQEILSWYKKRVLRIIPMYWFFNIISLLLVGGNGYWYGPDGKLSIKAIILNFLCIHGFNPYYINVINVNWFIADIMIWYVVAPVFMRIFRSIRSILLLLFAYMPVYLTISSRVNEAAGLDIQSKLYYTHFCFLAQFPIILIGVVLWKLLNEYSDLLDVLNRAIDKTLNNIAFVYLLILGINMIYGLFEGISVFGRDFTWGIYFGFLFSICFKRRHFIVDNKFWAVFGKYSLGLYLTHFTLILLVRKLFDLNEIIFTGEWQIIILFLGVCLISLFIAFFVEYIQDITIKQFRVLIKVGRTN